MSTFIKCGDEVVTLAHGILRAYESHAPLLAAKVKIDFVFALAAVDAAGNQRGSALMLHGQPCGGIARIIKYKDRVMGRGDVEVSLDGDWWALATAPEQRALLDHELHHFEVRMEGKTVVTDDCGRPVVKMRKHDYDFGWFEVIAARHGEASFEVQQARRMMAKSGKILLQTAFDFSLGEAKPTTLTEGAVALATVLSRRKRK